MTTLWKPSKKHIHITPPELVTAVSLGVSITAAVASTSGVSSFNPYITASGGSGRKLSPCGGIPLVSPGFHNPVERNGQ